MAEYEIFRGLSPRQMDILKLMWEGKSNIEIAEELNLSVETIKNHTTAMFTKLNVRSRIQAARVGLMNGWLECPTKDDIEE